MDLERGSIRMSAAALAFVPELLVGYVLRIAGLTAKIPGQWLNYC